MKFSSGKLRDQFVVDVYQAGAGTSHNMNANEVIANRAAEMLGAPRGAYTKVHPNDHVNMSQSTNDVFPTSMRLALLLDHAPLVDSARQLQAALEHKSREFAKILKVGRTHLQDAVPITLGEVFGGYAACIERGAEDVETASAQLMELNLGATAVGTGLNAGSDYAEAAINYLPVVYEVAGAPRKESVSRDPEHGRRRGVLGRDAAVVDRARQGRKRFAPAEHGTARGAL